ncbi:OmpA family protein [Rhodobacteraceae bacterium CCMM004]|nr:OmpA family protein [Rhodobacteraceae bacterium CCMM004]
MKFRVMAAVVLSLAVAPLAAPAQDAGQMTEAEIREAFAKQKTRGLSIAPVSGGAAQSATETETAATTQIAPAEEPATQVAFDAIPVEEQVNVNIVFDHNSAVLRDDQKPKLATLCTVMKSVEVQLFRILGHTDASGSDEYNERLSRLRAEEVKRHMVSDCGIPAERMRAEGVGERFLLDQANPRADVNRRVEFQVIG